MWQCIDLKAADYPDGLTIYVDGRSIYDIAPIPPRNWPITIDGTGWAEAAFEPRILAERAEYAKMLKTGFGT